MEFGVLGQLEAWRADERLPLGSFKQRSLLALLLIHANHAIASDQIIDELWGDAAGSDHHNALWVLVSRLRTVLEPERERRARRRGAGDEDFGLFRQHRSRGSRLSALRALGP